MIESKLRPIYQKICVDPFVSFLGKYTSPLHLTLLGCFFGVGAAVLIALQLSFFALVALFLSGYLDTLDGSVARYKKASSSFGAALDITLDRLVEFSIILGLFLIDPMSRGLPSLLMLGSILLCITTFLVVGIFSQNDSEKSFHYSPGLMERAEAFLFFVAMIILPSYFSLLAYIFTALVLLTAVIRLKQFSEIQKG